MLQICSYYFKKNHTFIYKAISYLFFEISFYKTSIRENLNRLPIHKPIMHKNSVNGRIIGIKLDKKS